jgi:hypothetical protein
LTKELSEKQIIFDKIDLNDELHSSENLSLISEDLITGTDSLGFNLEYKKNKDK